MARDNWESVEEFLDRARRRVGEMLDEKARVEAAIPGARADAEKLAGPLNEAHASYKAMFPALPSDSWARQTYVYSDGKVKAALANIAKARSAYQPAYDRVQRLRTWREGLSQRILEAEALIAQLEREEARKQADLDGPPPASPSLRQRIGDAIASALSPAEQELSDRAERRAERAKAHAEANS